MAQSALHAFRPFPDHFLHRPAGTFRVLAFLAQVGAGLYIDNGGVANLDGCPQSSNYRNMAGMSPALARFLPEPRTRLAMCL